jgi:hypothetical protein
MLIVEDDLGDLPVSETPASQEKVRSASNSDIWYRSNRRGRGKS